MASTEFSGQESAPESATEPFNRAEALAGVEGDVELMINLLDIFFGQVGPMMESIRTAVAANDPLKLERAAHLLKGSVSILCAASISQTAFAMEKMGRTQDLTGAVGTLALLEQQLRKLQPALKQFRSELQQSVVKHSRL